jgi:hypothetical protein
MGLMKLSGELYNFEEDTKLAMAGVSNLDQAPMENVLPDEQLQPVNATLPAQATPAPMPTPAPSTPAVSEPDKLVDPIEGPKGDNLLSPTSKSFKELQKTTLASYRGNNMSRLKHALHKFAMTEGDFLEMEEDPTQYQGTLGTTEDMENFNMPADYSNYLAAKAPSAQDSYDIGEAEMDDIYGQVPEDATYLGGMTTDADVEPGVYMQEVPYSPSDDSMGYSAYGYAPSDLEAMGYSAYGYSPSDLEAMGYSANPGVYDNYYQMYASPEAQAAEYQDVQTQALDPEQQAAADQKAVYDESYNEVYNYLIQMGYSPEEAAAAVPSLLSQVDVTPPEAAQPTKTASYMFKQAASDLVSEYIDAGYSPYQAREMSMLVVVPQAEKYASQARVIGGGVGALVGGAAGHSMYDDDGEISGALISAAIGGGLGAMAPGRLNKYTAKRLIASGGAEKEVARLKAVEKEIMREANAQQLALMNAELSAAGVPAAAKTIEEAKILAGHVGADFGNLGKAQRKAYGEALGRFEALKKDRGAAVQAVQDFAAAEAAAARARDIKGALAVAVPGTMVHRYAASHGGDNFVDNTFEAADYLGDRVGDAGRAIMDNPEYLAAAAGGYGLLRGGAELASHLKKRKAEGPNKKKSRTKKANMEIQAQELQKIASLLARAGGGLVGSVAGAALGGAATDDHYAGQAGGALIGALAGAGVPLTAYKGLGHLIKAPAASGAGAAASGAAAPAMGAWNKYLGQTAASMGIGAASGIAGEVERERQRVEDAWRRGDFTAKSNFLRAATRGGGIGALVGGVARMNPFGARGVAGAALAYPGYMIGKSALKRTGRAAENIDLNPFSEESMRAFGQGFGDIANIGQQSARAVGISPEQAQEKGNAAIEWAKENPYLAGAAALGTAGALYGGYRAFTDDEETPQQKLEALRRKRNV